MKILVTPMKGRPVDQGEMEIVERKGIGHPDSLCDAAAEALSIDLCRYYQEHFGRILHYNVDKVALVGGAARARFGGGRVTRPMKLLFIGRATSFYEGQRIPVKQMAMEAGRRVFAGVLPHLDLDRHLSIECLVRPGSADLIANYDTSDKAASNDTSLGVGFAPETETEKVVGKVEAYLNGKVAEKRHPEWGQDVKVMGTRVGKDLNLTVALAFVAQFVPDYEFYLQSRERAAAEILKVARRHTSLKVTVDVNQADKENDKDSVYLTVTGTSAEAGDDGQVGRGNRPNGLITPYRPMTLEAAAGKNPTTHVGKIYNLAAWDIADKLAKVDGIESVHVYLVSQIGAPVKEPQALEIRAKTKLKKKELEAVGRKVAEKVLRDMDKLPAKLLAGKYRVC